MKITGRQSCMTKQTQNTAIQSTKHLARTLLNCLNHVTIGHTKTLCMYKKTHREQQACLVLVDGLASADGIHKLGNAAALPCQDGLHARPRTMSAKPPGTNAC